MRNAFKISDIEEILKQLFVEEAQKLLRQAGEQESLSRLSIMTGLQRPAVSVRIANQHTASSPSPTGNSLLIKVMGCWTSNSRYLTKSGRPRVLTVEGKQSEFASMVQSVSQALNPYTVLFELERAGIIRKTKQGVTLLYSTLIATKDTAAGLAYAALDTQDLLAAVEHNLFDNPALPHHHITTEYDSIPRSQEPKLRALLLREGNRLHKKIRSLLSKFDTDVTRENNNSFGEEKVRVAFSSFSHIHSIHERSNQ